MGSEQEDDTDVSRQFDDSRLDEVYQYWRSKRPATGLPNRADIQPRELGPLLPLINLVEVHHDPLRFVHRLVGSEYVKWLGRDVTGQEMDEKLYGDGTADIVQAQNIVVAMAMPYRRVSRMHWHKDQDWLVMESAELPLVGETGQIVMILRGAVFTRRLTSRGPKPVLTPLD